MINSGRTVTTGNRLGDVGRKPWSVNRTSPVSGPAREFGGPRHLTARARTCDLDIVRNGLDVSPFVAVRAARNHQPDGRWRCEAARYRRALGRQAKRARQIGQRSLPLSRADDVGIGLPPESRTIAMSRETAPAWRPASPHLECNGTARTLRYPLGLFTPDR